MSASCPTHLHHHSGQQRRRQVGSQCQKMNLYDIRQTVTTSTNSSTTTESYTTMVMMTLDAGLNSNDQDRLLELVQLETGEKLIDLLPPLGQSYQSDVECRLLFSTIRSISTEFSGHYVPLAMLSRLWKHAKET